MSNATLNYTITTSQAIMFDNANSYIQIQVSPLDGSSEAAYVELPDEVANDRHIQKMFSSTEGGTVTNGVLFDIYFPRLPNLSSMPIKIYPAGTDPSLINESTPFFSTTLSLGSAMAGSALLLGLEDKEKNVRVLPRTGTPAQPASYTWTATILPEATSRIINAIVHVTDLYDTNFIKSVNFKANGVDISPIIDPLTGKHHLYFKTLANGLATLEITPTGIACWGHLIYWPFADNASEVARIVIYDTDRFGLGLFGTIPDKNPITLSEYTPPNGPSFTIHNDASPRAIDDGGSLYFLINDSYNITVPSSSNKNIKITASTHSINGSTGESPQANTARYIYTKQNGDTLTSPKYSFFAFSGVQ
ncbi:hypothetical protein [Brucella sp. bbatCR03]|uniref:hypothetical protein n=2 Tax=unclassified Brucella TaxID=2632610 RepID=UPI0024E0E2E2|nr:hypothetical protein [Brucella sp. bbatCR03]